MKAPIPNHLKRHLHDLRYSEAVHVLHSLDMGNGFFVRVVGDGNNGCYEWLIERPFTQRPMLEFSNVGYGDSTVALRDGLIAYHGLPDRDPGEAPSPRRMVVSVTKLAENVTAITEVAK